MNLGIPTKTPPKDKSIKSTIKRVNDYNLKRLNVLRSPEEGKKKTEGRGTAKKEDSSRTEKKKTKTTNAQVHK